MQNASAAFAGTLQRFRDSDDVRANASYFLGSGAMLWIVWQVATLAGAINSATLNGVLTQ